MWPSTKPFLEAIEKGIFTIWSRSNRSTFSKVSFQSDNFHTSKQTAAKLNKLKTKKSLFFNPWVSVWIISKHNDFIILRCPTVFFEIQAQRKIWRLQDMWTLWHWDTMENMKLFFNTRISEVLGTWFFKFWKELMIFQMVKIDDFFKSLQKWWFFFKIW